MLSYLGVTFHTELNFSSRSRSFRCLELYYRYDAEARKRITHLALQSAENLFLVGCIFLPKTVPFCIRRGLPMRDYLILSERGVSMTVNERNRVIELQHKGYGYKRISEFDEKLWLSVIDTVTVHADGRLTFKFQGGTEIEA